MESSCGGFANFSSKHTDVEKNIFLEGLHDRNETVFLLPLQNHIAEMVPIIYTPTVGQACQRYSPPLSPRARGLPGLSDRETHLPDLDNVREEIEIIVVTDGERILGWGPRRGRIGISRRKLAL